MRNFRELEIWKDARKLVKDIYLTTKLLPDTEKYGLVSQINRCSVSIAANIAEGCAKYSNKDFVRFLQISLGSAYELENHLILCEDLEFIIPEQASPIIKKVQRLQKRIASLIKYNKQSL
ncbi:four helix bundle protein [Flagellimonas pacifica]|uniref:Four helix bundle protein n=1 Tax=Flagellimonas pacifica TaxID=1247520 RepID=A0A285MUR4_9FLAO|nr:four helix bundle protein [Allomuricauda parva]SNZ00915.1 four helix bundle protein [Allomuricauda parva]